MSSALMYVVLVYATLLNSSYAFWQVLIPGYTSARPEIHRVSSERSTWNTARRTCREQGGSLAIVSSVAEAETISRLLNETNVEFGWVGVHDYFQEDEFVTIQDVPLALTGFNVWRAGEPNNWRGNEHCVLFASDGKLMDETCTTRFNYICKFPHIDQPPAPTNSTQPEPTTASESVNTGPA